MQKILDVADSFTAYPASEILDILSESVRQAGCGIAETFFNQHSTPALWNGKDFSCDRDKMAIALVSNDLSKVKANLPERQNRGHQGHSPKTMKKAYFFRRLQLRTFGKLPFSEKCAILQVPLIMHKICNLDFSYVSTCIFISKNK